MGVIQQDDIDESIARLRLNRPSKLNALNKELLQQIAGQIREIDQAGYPVLIIEGAGDAFTAGLDLDEAEDDGVNLELFQDMTRAVREFEGIVIGKLHGYTIGGGFELTLSFDLRYAAPDTVFQMTETEVGVTVSNASTKLLPLIVGDGNARELVFTGRRFNAEEAEDMGLVSAVLPHDELDTHVREVAQDIAENKSEQACSLIKRGFNHAYPLDDTLEYERLLHIENTLHENE